MATWHHIQLLLSEHSFKSIYDLRKDLTNLISQRLVEFSVIDEFGLQGTEEILNHSAIVGTKNHLEKSNILDRWGTYRQMTFSNDTSLLLTHLSSGEIFGRANAGNGNPVDDLLSAEILFPEFRTISASKHPELCGPTIPSLLGQQITSIELLKLEWPEFIDDLSEAAPDIFPEPTLSISPAESGWGGIVFHTHSGNAYCMGPAVQYVPDVMYGSDYVILESALDESLVIERYAITAP